MTHFDYFRGHHIFFDGRFFIARHGNQVRGYTARAAEKSVAKLFMALRKVYRGSGPIFFLLKFQNKSRKKI